MRRFALCYFLDAVRKHREAKSSRKLAEAYDGAVRAGRNLTFAICGMKQRMETEEREGELFHVSDYVSHPITFRTKIGVRVSYRWRETVEDDWIHSSITFTHLFSRRPSYGVPAPKRKASAAKQAEALQEEMFGVWDHIRRTALFTVRDFFREGGREPDSRDVSSRPGFQRVLELLQRPVLAKKPSNR